MNDLTINEVVNFFQRLDLKKKVEMLNELTNVLNKGVKDGGAIPKTESSNRDEEHQIIDSLFGAWTDEKELTESKIIRRTSSDREINLD